MPSGNPVVPGIRRMRRRLRIWGGLVPALVLLAGGVAVAERPRTPEVLWPKDCAQIAEDSGSGESVVPRSCADPASILLITSRTAGTQSCPSTSYLHFVVPGATTRTYCAALRLRTGECFHRGPPTRVVDCSPGPNIYRVTRVRTGTYDTATCGSVAGGAVYAYLDPPSVTCAAPVAADGAP